MIVGEQGDPEAGLLNGLTYGYGIQRPNDRETDGDLCSDVAINASVQLGRLQPQRGSLQLEPGHTVAPYARPCSRQQPAPGLLVYARGAVEASVQLEHLLHLSCDIGVLGRPLSRRLVPLSPGVVTAAGHANLPSQPGDGAAAFQVVDQAKPLGGSLFGDD